MFFSDSKSAFVTRSTDDFLTFSNSSHNMTLKFYLMILLNRWQSLLMSYNPLFICFKSSSIIPIPIVIECIFLIFGSKNIAPMIFGKAHERIIISEKSITFPNEAIAPKICKT